MGPQNRALVDRMLFTGGPTRCIPDVGKISHLTLRAGANGVEVYRWTPLSQAVVLPEDRGFADQIRIAASILGATVLDVMILAEQSYWSGRE